MHTDAILYLRNHNIIIYNIIEDLKLHLLNFLKLKQSVSKSTAFSTLSFPSLIFYLLPLIYDSIHVSHTLQFLQLGLLFLCTLTSLFPYCSNSVSDKVYLVFEEKVSTRLRSGLVSCDFLEVRRPFGHLGCTPYGTAV